MKIKTLLIFLLLIFAFINTASAVNAWTPNSSIVSGLSDVGTDSASTVFLDGSALKLISGNNDGTFIGWDWNGSAWVSNSSIVSGLSDVGFHSAPTVFLDGSTLKLIAGDWDGTFTGWYWDGSTWVLDASIISGLTDVGGVSKPTVFLDGSTLKLIAGENTPFVFTDTLNGWYWNGATWVSDANVVSGTSDSVQGTSPSVFTKDDTLKLISGTYWGTFTSWYWSGSAWVLDASIRSGLSDVGYWSTPNVYLDGSDLKIIVGAESGLFEGWSELILYTLSGTISNENGVVNNATITLSGAGGSTTSNEIGYYEITGITSDTYSISVTETSHEDYSGTVTITSDTEKNILLTFVPPEIIPIIAPPPIVPVEEPTPFVEIEKQVKIIEEIMIEIENFTFEKVTVLFTKALSWAFILTSYIGAIASHLTLKKEDEDQVVFDVLLFGTVGWALLLLINISGYIAVVTESFILNALIFGIAGFVVYTVLNMLSSKE